MMLESIYSAELSSQQKTGVCRDRAGKDAIVEMEISDGAENY